MADITKHRKKKKSLLRDSWWGGRKKIRDGGDLSSPETRAPRKRTPYSVPRRKKALALWLIAESHTSPVPKGWRKLFSNLSMSYWERGKGDPSLWER